MIDSIISWIPASLEEIRLLRLDPVIPWPMDQIKVKPVLCHVRLWKLVELYG